MTYGVGGLFGDWFYKVREDDILPYKLLIGDFFGGRWWFGMRGIRIKNLNAPSFRPNAVRGEISCYHKMDLKCFLTS